MPKTKESIDKSSVKTLKFQEAPVDAPGFAAEVVRSINERNALIDQISLIDDALRDGVRDAIRSGDDPDERLEIASYFYFHVPLVGVVPIAEALLPDVPTITAQNLYKFVKKPQTNCGSCGVPMQSNVTRTSILSCSEKTLLCHVCVELERRKRSDEWRERQEEQNRMIEYLRTMPYAQYLATNHWAELRQQKLKQAWYRCQLCSSKGALEVHHRTYERRGNEYLTDLIVLCNGCHSKFHDKLSRAEKTFKH
jgi:5-methylcytosine-specific restriction endonuclease McrA